MQTIKVLQINSYYGVGSTGNIVRSIEKKGTECGYDMYAIYWLARRPELENSHVIYCGRSSDTSSIPKLLQWIFDGGKLSYNKKMTLSILDTVKRISPDIIHLHNLHGDFEYGMIDFPLLMQEINKLNVKVVWTLHDCWAFTGRCYYYAYKNCTRWKNKCGKCPQRLYDREGVFKDLSECNLQTKCNIYKSMPNLHIVAVSKWLASEAKQSILKNNDIRVIYNGINLDVFDMNSEKKTNSDKFTILCISWDRRKGYQDYFTLSKMLKSDEEILVLGNRPFFRSFRKLPSNIRCVSGTSNPKRMAEIYNFSNVYFNASSAETFGLTTVEALACGIPVVGYHSTATPEIVGDSEYDGITVSDKNVREIYQAIERLREIEGQGEEFGKKRHERVSALFDINRMAKEYINLYADI